MSGYTWQKAGGPVADWPGISLVKNVLSGELVRGTWFDRTAEHRDKLRRKEVELRRHVTEETVELSQPPLLASPQPGDVSNSSRGWSRRSACRPLDRLGSPPIHRPAAGQ
jgi:hypothetical protein